MRLLRQPAAAHEGDRAVQPGPVGLREEVRRAVGARHRLHGAQQFTNEVVTAGAGDLVVVPPGRPHAFAAAPGCDADMLIVITPGVERLEYFRHLQRTALGEVTAKSLLEVQERYDTYFLHNAAWDRRR